MYELSVEAEFCAAHALLIGGRREPLHGHNWRVTVTVAGPALDADGLLVDFHAVERSLAGLLRPFRDRNLNEVEPFIAINPSAEHVARHIGAEIARTLPPGVRLAGVRVTEAVGCAAVYRPEPG